MPLHNYRCECGNEKNDQYYPINEVPRRLKCACGKMMEQHWGRGFNWKRPLRDALGSELAKYHPAFGYDEEVNSIDEYHALRKKYGMEEAGDPVGGTREWRREALEKQKAQRRNPAAQVATDEQVREAMGNV